MGGPSGVSKPFPHLNGVVSGKTYIAVVRPVSLKLIPSWTNDTTKTFASDVPVASVPVVLKPVPKVRV